MIGRPPSSPLFPYTTLFRSNDTPAYKRMLRYDSTIAKLMVSLDRKSTRLNSSHGYISYAVFCLKKTKKRRNTLEVRNEPNSGAHVTHARPTHHDTDLARGDLLMTYTSLCTCAFILFFFNDTATTEIYTLSLHDALPISSGRSFDGEPTVSSRIGTAAPSPRSEEHTSELQSRLHLVCRLLLEKKQMQ